MRLIVTGSSSLMIIETTLLGDYSFISSAAYCLGATEMDLRRFLRFSAMKSIAIAFSLPLGTIKSEYFIV